MKSFRFKGKGGKFNSKGAKYKRFMWKKNKFKSQFGASSRNNDDDDDDYNLNLIGNADFKQQKQPKGFVFLSLTYFSYFLLLLFVFLLSFFLFFY